MTHPNAAHSVSPGRSRRMLDALIGGFSLGAIGEEEDLPVGAVERAVRDELGARWTAPPADFAKIQIARLEAMFALLMDRIDAGELAPVDRALRIIDRFDRYHGFRPATPAVEPYGETHRERLLAKLNAAAANLADPETSHPAEA